MVTHSFVFISFFYFCIKYCYMLPIQRQMVVPHILYFMLCQSSLLSAVISFVKSIYYLST